MWMLHLKIQSCVGPGWLSGTILALHVRLEFELESALVTDDDDESILPLKPTGIVLRLENGGY